MCLHLLHVKVKVLDSGEEVMIFADGHMQVRVTVFNRIFRFLITKLFSPFRSIRPFKFLV
jgi:hypothetical protein